MKLTIKNKWPTPGCNLTALREDLQRRVDSESWREIMRRFFFDYTSKDSSLLDYKGEEFTSPKGAVEFAEAIALDLAAAAKSWHGWSVEVRDAAGTKFRSLSIDSAAA